MTTSTKDKYYSFILSGYISLTLHTDHNLVVCVDRYVYFPLLALQTQLQACNGDKDIITVVVLTRGGGKDRIIIVIL